MNNSEITNQLALSLTAASVAWYLLFGLAMRRVVIKKPVGAGIAIGLTFVAMFGWQFVQVAVFGVVRSNHGLAYGISIIACYKLLRAKMGDSETEQSADETGQKFEQNDDNPCEEPVDFDLQTGHPEALNGGQNEGAPPSNSSEKL